MADTIVVILAGGFLFQFVLGIFAYMDANRRELDSPVAYFYGISIPFIGFFLFAVYLSRREELPARNLSPPTATETAGEAVWTIENRGIRRFPQRLAYTIQGRKTLWRVAVVGPPLLLVLTVLVDSRIAAVLFLFCCLFWLTYLSTARVFTNTTIRLDPTDGTIQVTWRGGDHPLSPSGSEQEIDLTDVQRVELRRVGTQPLVIFRYETRLSDKPRSVLVPPDQIDVFRNILSTHDIPSRDRIQEGTSRTVVWLRSIEGLISLVVIPFGAGFVWPEFFFTGPVGPLMVFIILWLVVKCFVGVFHHTKSLLGLFSNQH